MKNEEDIYGLNCVATIELLLRRTLVQLVILFDFFTNKFIHKKWSLQKQTPFFSSLKTLPVYYFLFSRT